jgi:hypothetical protein
MTTAEAYYEAIAHMGAGSLYYLIRKDGSEVEFIFEPLIVDTNNKDQTINILKRAMQHPNFIAFPGTPEMITFIDESAGSSENK